MGVFDNKDDATKSGGFSDVSADTSSSMAGNSAPADFSDVSSGASSNAPEAASDQTYTVKSGDSLSHIAKHVYGDAKQWHKIYEANRDQIKNPDLIQPGWVLTIPSA